MRVKCAHRVHFDRRGKKHKQKTKLSHTIAFHLKNQHSVHSIQCCWSNANDKVHGRFSHFALYGGFLSIFLHHRHLLLLLSTAFYSIENNYSDHDDHHLYYCYYYLLAAFQSMPHNAWMHKHTRSLLHTHVHRAFVAHPCDQVIFKLQLSS